MYSVRLAALLFGLCGFGGVSAASEEAIGQSLAQSSACMACHQVDQKRVGPAFRVVAQKWVGLDGAEAYLANSIVQGSRGKWGAVPMPAQRQVSAANARLIAAWILSLDESSTHDVKKEGS